MHAEATRMNRVHPSPSTVAAGRARELREQGVAVLDLTVGEPDFDTPDNVKAAGIAAIERGDTKYTAVNGTAELRAAIIGRLLRLTGVEYSAAEISVGSARQARDLHRADGDAQPRRRGDHPGPVLGVLPRHGGTPTTAFR